MMKASKAFPVAALAAIVLGLAACASQKEPAEQAMAALEQKFAESSAEIRKYLPERHAELQTSLESLRQAMGSEDYRDVVAGAATAEADLKRAIADSRVKRAQTIAAMENEWNDLVKEMPAMISAMDKKISSQRGRPPEGMTRESWKQTIADYDAARDAKAKIAAIMDSLGVKAS